MAVQNYSPPITRRLFLEKSITGTAALTLSGLVILPPAPGMCAAKSPLSFHLSSPQFPAWSDEGYLFVTFVSEDGNYGLLRKEGDASNKMLSAGTATGQFNWPQGIAISGHIVYIADSNNGRIQRFDFALRRFLDPIGRLGKKSGLLLRPRGICVFKNELFIADTRNHRIQVFSMDGVVKRIIGELGDADEQFRLPSCCVVSPEAEIFVVDSKHSLIKVFDLEGRFLRKFGGLSSSRKEPGLLSMPTGIAVDGNKGLVYIADTGNSRIQIFDKQERFVQFIEAPGMEFRTPQGLSLSASGELAISDPEADKVWLAKV